MEAFNILIIIVAGLLGGFVNAVSAAGSLITLPAFIFAGLSPSEANATNRVAILAQNFSSASAFRTKGMPLEPYMLWASLAAMPGAMLGAWYSLKIPDELFTKILAVVMLLFLGITIFNPLKGNKAGNEKLDAKTKATGLVAYFFIGIYGGFIQAGTGFFLMATSLLLHRFEIVKNNYYKAVVMFMYTLAAFAVFVFKGNIFWLQGCIMGAAMGVGAFFGSRWTIVASDVWIKRVIAALIISMAIYLWFFK